MGSMEQPHIDWKHGQWIIAAKSRQASGAESHNMGASGRSLAAKLGDGFKKDGSALSAAFRVLKIHLPPDGSTADGADDHVDEVAILSTDTFRDRGDIVSVAFDDLQIGCGARWENSLEL